MSAPAWPLSPVEELDWYLESPGEPSLVQLETQVSGHLDPAALARALEAALAADPAARRRLAPASAWRRHPRWEVPSGAPREVSLAVTAWTSQRELDALRESLTTVPVPLTERALRLTLAAGADRDVLFLQVHHAAFDGISALALLSAVGDAYRALAPVSPLADSTPPPRGDSDDLTACPRATAAPSSRARPARGLPGTVIRVAGRRKGPARPGYGFAQWDGPVLRPEGHGAGPHPTVNDLLVAALILTVHRWNARHRGEGVPGFSRGRISVAVPVNTRDSRHRWTGPGNQSRVIRVRARTRECEQPLVLLASVSRQVRAARERPRPGLDGASRVLARGWAPAGVKRVAIRLARRLAAPFVTDTALVSNLGLLPLPPSFADPDGPRPLWFAGPAPMPRGIGVGALTAAGRLHLALVYSRALFDAEAAEDFAEAYRLALAGLAVPAPDDALPEREAS